MPPAFRPAPRARRFLGKHKGIEGQRLNRMLVKDPLGASRHTTYKLPPADFSFGIKAIPDAYNAKACITGWHAPDQRQGRKPARGNRTKALEGATFGRPRPPKDCDTGDVLRNHFGERPRRQDPEYAANSKISKPHVAPAASVRPTHAYTLAARRARALAAAGGKGADPADASGPGAGTMAAAAMAAAATAAGRTDGKVRLNGEGDWKIKRFGHAKAVLDTHVSRPPAAYLEMLRRDGKLKPRAARAAAAAAAEAKSVEEAHPEAGAEAEAEA